MRLLLALALTLVLAAPAAAAEPRASLPDIEDEVMCVQCGVALNISEAPVAERERELIRRLIAQGRTKEEIKQALVVEYGPAVLAMPDDDGFNVAAYVVPPLLGLAGLLGIALAVRRWRRAPAPAGATVAAARLAPEDARRLDAELAAYDR